MSKIEELIKEMCSDGVEYKQIKDISKVLRGKRLTKDKLDDSNPYPVYHGGLEPLGYYGQANRPANMVMVINVGASAGTIAYSDTEFWSSDGCFCIEKTQEINEKFLYYYLKNNEYYFMTKVRVAGIPALDNYVVELFEIPVPPLDIQQEIVRILDTFMELESELQAELEARKKQYEYYSDELLAFSSDVEIVTLEKCAEIGTGSSNTVDGIEGGQYPFYVRSQKPLTMDSYEFDEIATITAGDGVGVGKVFHFVNGKYALHQRAYRIHITDGRINPKFFHYYFMVKFPKFIFGNMYESSVPSIRRPMLNKFEVPVPSLQEQNRIVEILDKFEEYCNNLKTGLPAEIEARHKQYEYYRDKLLTFERKVV